MDETGFYNSTASFSAPRGFPSYTNAEVSGSAREENLGYGLTVACGAIVDNRGLIVPVVVGDGEYETGFTAVYARFVLSHIGSS